jgi:hypothetical protein
MCWDHEIDNSISKWQRPSSRRYDCHQILRYQAAVSGQGCTKWEKGENQVLNYTMV